MREYFLAVKTSAIIGPRQEKKILFQPLIPFKPTLYEHFKKIIAVLVKKKNSYSTAVSIIHFALPF